MQLRKSGMRTSGLIHSMLSEFRVRNGQVVVVADTCSSDMSSDDVLSFFKQFDPASLEWVNDTSCNVVFDDAQTATKAMAQLTTHRICSAAIPQSESAIPVMEATSLETAVPDGTWLLGHKHEKAKHLLIRFAKSGDKKKTGAGKFSEYYRKYGNPHYGGKKQIMSSSLADKLKKMSEMEGMNDDEDAAEEFDDVRASVTDESSFRQSSPESPPRRPLGLRMKMRADDEEEEKARSKTLHASDKDKKSVWDRLENRSVKDRLEKKSVMDRLDKGSVLDRIGGSSRVIQRTRISSRGSAQSVWDRLSGNESSGRKEGGKRSVLYSNIKIKK